MESSIYSIAYIEGADPVRLCKAVPFPIPRPTGNEDKYAEFECRFKPTANVKRQPLRCGPSQIAGDILKDNEA